jgi:hypothetical protein
LQNKISQHTRNVGPFCGESLNSHGWRGCIGPISSPCTLQLAVQLIYARRGRAKNLMADALPSGRRHEARPGTPAATRGTRQERRSPTSASAPGRARRPAQILLRCGGRNEVHALPCYMQRVFGHAQSTLTMCLARFCCSASGRRLCTATLSGCN